MRTVSKYFHFSLCACYYHNDFTSSVAVKVISFGNYILIYTYSMICTMDEL